MNQVNFGWQSRYYDRVIRNASELNRIRTYINDNPSRWADEQSNPKTCTGDVGTTPTPF